MSQICTTKGLNLPFKENANESIVEEKRPKTVCIDLSSFTYLHLKLTKEVSTSIIKGEVLAKDIHLEERVFISPVSGVILEIIRGDRRKITGVIIELSDTPSRPFDPINTSLKKNQLMDELFRCGLSFVIHKRPFNRAINKTELPSSIFINTITSAPYTPSYAHIFKGNEQIFQTAISLLAKFSNVHVFYNEDIFSSFSDCVMHKATGPHPIESPSLHISAIKPITSIKDVLWTLDVYDVLSVGYAMLGEVFNQRVVAISGNGFDEKDRILIQTLTGASIGEICPDAEHLIAGNPLTGELNHPFLRRKDFSITSFTPHDKDEILPFIKPGLKKCTATKTYLGGFFKKHSSPFIQYKLGGEKRPFILKDIYQLHFPFHIYIEPLIKALLAKDYELAISLGFLEIDETDLSIAEYICPSKISLMAIFKQAKKEYLL